MLCRNVGRFDRGLRIVVGIILLSLCVVGPKTLWGLIGFVPLVTGLAGTCPLYRLFGKTSCDIRSKT